MTFRTLIGQFAPGDVRIRLSKLGYDVTAAIDREFLAFDSSWKDGATVYAIGSISHPGTVNFVTVTFADTLPNLPFVYCWLYDSSTVINACDTNSSNTSYRPYPVFVTTTGIKFGAQHITTGGEPYTVGYIVIRASGNG